MSQDPKSILIQQIEERMTLIQKTIGQNHANDVATITMIMDSMAKTILTQFDELVVKDARIAELEAKLTPVPVKPETEEPNTSDNSLE